MERTGPAAGTRSQTGTQVRSPTHADGTSVRFVSTDAGEQTAGEKDGKELTLHASPDMMAQLVGMQQDLLRTAHKEKKDSQAPVEGEGYTVMYRRVGSRWEESSGEAPCCPTEDLELEKLEEVDMECVQYHCDATIMVPDNHEQKPWKVRAVLDSGAGVSCISEKMAADLGARFEGTQLYSP